ncbi:MAG: hypothetical protein QOF91_2653 [Alphaproteobacteria bacterium]|jgi:hypothetical protein|nr:hypothetical protein [Alphaproteobacteria bacterium]
MTGVDRVALVGWLWFIGWIVAGDLIGRWFEMPGTGLVVGFLFALITVPAWPWVMPEFVDDWMYDPHA